MSVAGDLNLGETLVRQKESWRVPDRSGMFRQSGRDEGCRGARNERDRIMLWQRARSGEWCVRWLTFQLR
jgi:hypothetical protein